MELSLEVEIIWMLVVPEQRKLSLVHRCPYYKEFSVRRGSPLIVFNGLCVTFFNFLFYCDRLNNEESEKLIRFAFLRSLIGLLSKFSTDQLQRKTNL